MVVITIAVMSVFFYALLMTVDLPDSSTILDFIEVLVWPVLIAAVLFGYYKPLSAMLRATRFSKVTLRLFGVEIEVPIARLERVPLMTFPDGRMTREQYDWLADMRERGGKIDAPRQAEDRLGGTETVETIAERRVDRDPAENCRGRKPAPWPGRNIGAYAAGETLGGRGHSPSASFLCLSDVIDCDSVGSIKDAGRGLTVGDCRAGAQLPGRASWKRFRYRTHPNLRVASLSLARTAFQSRAGSNPCLLRRAMVDVA